MPSYERVLPAAERYRMKRELRIMVTSGVTHTVAEGRHIGEVLSAKIRQ
jgi:hypothetical protein